MSKHGTALVRCTATVAALSLAVALLAGNTVTRDARATPSSQPVSSEGRVFTTSFESINDFAGSYIVPQNHLGTASHEQSTEQVRTGMYSHKGWVYGSIPPPAPDNHRAYPTVQLHRLPGGGYVCPCSIRFWAWLDMPLDEPGEWFSFATMARSTEDANWNAVTVNVSAPNPAPGTTVGGVLHLMHVPTAGLRQPRFQTSTIMFPMREWVEIEIYIDFDPDHGEAMVWQDGQLVSSAPVGGGHGLLEQVHFGMYAHPNVDSGVVYNEDLEIRELLVDSDSDGFDDRVDNCPDASNATQADSDEDALGDACESAFSTDPDDSDTDGDGCADGREARPLTFSPGQGGDRDPAYAWDFYDVTGDRVVDLQDTLSILWYFGNPGPSPEADLRDRSTPNAAKPWRSAEANNGIDLVDALANLKSFGSSCLAPV